MNEIPDEIMAKARTYLGKPCDLPVDSTAADCAAVYIARAILAERERAANVARTFGNGRKPYRDGLHSVGKMQLRDDIATAIRSGQ